MQTFQKKVLIEKPLFENFFNINFKLNNTYYVGYNMRYHPVIVYLKKFLFGKRINFYNCNCSSNLKFWRKNVTYEKSNTACKRGGGALLELSHEFDYTNYLIGKYSVKKNFFGKLSNLKIGVEDFFIIIARNKKTKFIQISANIFSNINTRLVSIELQNISVQGDLINNTIEFFGKKNLEKLNLLQRICF